MTHDAGADCAAMAILPTLEASDPRLRVLSPLAKTIDGGLRPLLAVTLEQVDDAPRIGLAA